ncbi:MAG: potassium transporter KefB [Bacteroidetes bacterium]|nr:potassium transporter KefB [Bacteroidota bacterium]
MTHGNLTTQPAHKGSLAKPMAIGAGIAFILITLFLFPVFGLPHPEWSKLWMIRPLIVVPLAGATGGLFYHLLENLRYRGGSKRVLANVLSLVIYVFGLWIGTVLGLAGTLWH